jgi:chaperonin GroES
MTFKPIGDRVLVRRLESESTTSGGLVIPEQARRKLNRGELLAVGDEVEAVELEPGVEVVFGPYTGDEITLEGEALLVLRADELLGVLVPPCEVCGGSGELDPYPLDVDPFAALEPCPYCNPRTSEAP